MIVVNLWFIKHSNGLFHYGMDYAVALSADVREIWVRDDTLARLVAARLPTVPIRILDAKSLVRAALATVRRRDALFTPSSHPIAFVPRQTVVVHDSFPFEGKAGRLKRLLFRVGLFASHGVAGYINHVDGYQFLETCGVPSRRTRYLPNRIGDTCASAGNPAMVGDRIVVGLFGSDSPKKNYDAMFAQAKPIARLADVQWRIFGHENEYTERLKQDYPSCPIVVVASDTMTLDEFLDTIDIAVSTAKGEGFARPIALSLMRGIPTWLLDTPVFREFYQGSARLFPTVAALVDALAAIEPGDRLERPVLRTENALRTDFVAGIAWLKQR
jgi:hypothetical protein